MTVTADQSPGNYMANRQPPADYKDENHTSLYFVKDFSGNFAQEAHCHVTSEEEGRGLVEALKRSGIQKVHVVPCRDHYVVRVPKSEFDRLSLITGIEEPPLPSQYRDQVDSSRTGGVPSGAKLR